MNKVFLDANILIDILTLRSKKSNEYIESLKSIDYSKIYMSVLSVHIAYYVLKIKPNSDLANEIRDFCEAINLISLSEDIVYDSININYSDFEDCLQYITALNSKCDVILTGDTKDFEKIKNIYPSDIEIVSSL